MKKSNQQGFSPVIILLVLILVAIVGFAGYYVYNTQQNKKTETKQAVVETKKAEATKSTTPAVDTRKDFTSKALALSMKLPTGWTAADEPEGYMTILKSGDYAETTTGIGNTIPTKGANIKISTDLLNGQSLEKVVNSGFMGTLIESGNVKLIKVSVGNKEALEYVWAYEQPAVTSTSFIVGDKVVTATYASTDNAHTGTTYTDYKSMLETIK